MSWLSEIVERSYTLSGEDEPYWQAKRMARVIRELAVLVKRFHAMSPVPQINLQKAVDISPDVKEVIGEL